jgi:hypothetical protein
MQNNLLIKICQEKIEPDKGDVFKALPSVLWLPRFTAKQLNSLPH